MGEINISTAGVKSCNDIKMDHQGKRIRSCFGVVLIAMHMRHYDDVKKREFAFVCFMHSVSIWLKAFQHEGGGIPVALYFSKFYYVLV